MGELHDQLDKMHEHGRQKQNDQNDENRRLWDAIDNHRHDLKAVTEDSGQPMAVVSRPVSGSTSTSMGSTGYTRSLSSPSSHFSYPLASVQAPASVHAPVNVRATSIPQPSAWGKLVERSEPGHP